MMRLLTYDNHNNLCVTRDLGDSEVKPYAILSHTWGADEEEVTFHEISLPTSEQKPGYKKIEYCGKQARQDGWQHFWVDTCCIDKANHTELSKAITSMYRWYAQAQVCYIYLADVPSPSTLTEEDWQSSFRQSRWFTRGWTLQELLAPRNVVFYSREWERLGTKDELKELLCEITGIPTTALKGRPLSQFTINERMAWAQGRQTKEAEDQAYCMLGIFGVYMYLNYGEGDNAFRRLQKELDAHTTSSKAGESAPDYTSQRSASFKFGLDLTEAPVIEDDLFIGRSSQLQEMESVLRPEHLGSKHHRIVLGGMGGIGKTQLAIAYAKRHSQIYDSIFWLNAASEIALKQSLRQMAGRVLDIKSCMKLEDDELGVRITRWLLDNQNTRWLLIFDNYDEPDAFDVSKYCPYGRHGSAIITTRFPDAVQGQKLFLKPLDDINDSLDILATRLQRPDVHSDPYARDLAARMQGLPLALATAGAFLCKSTWTFERYLREYEERWNVQPRRPLRLQEYRGRTLYATWDVSYSRLEKEDADAARLLKLLAYFDNQHLWFELFHKGIDDDTPDWLKDIMADAANFEDVMRLLTDYGFVDVHSASHSYSIHTCVHDYASAGLNDTVDRNGYQFAFNCVANSVVDVQQDELAYLQYAQLVPHARRLAHRKFKADTTTGSAIHLDKTMSIGRLLQQQVQLDAAEEMYLRAMVGREQALGMDHASTLTTVTDLGLLYADQGKLEGAEQMYDRALSGCEKALGMEHELTLTTCNNLGMLYSDQGKLAEAEQMYDRALAGREKALGAEHILTLDTVHNLGALYCDQGKLAEAEQMFKQALAGCERVLGLEHASTLITVNQIGLLYADQGKLLEAEHMYERALAGYEKALGAEHISVLETINNLGNLYSDQGKLAEAEQMYDRALAGREKALGGEHTSTLDTIHNLGCLYHDQGKLVEAEQMYERALAGCETTLGLEHTSTLMTVYFMGRLYFDQGKLAEAERMHEQALSGYSKTVNEEHPQRLEQMLDYADLLLSQLKLGEAKQMCQRVTETCASCLSGTSSRSQTIADAYARALYKLIAMSDATNTDAQSHLHVLVKYLRQEDRITILMIQHLAKALLHLKDDENVRQVLHCCPTYSLGQKVDLGGTRCKGCHLRLDTDVGMNVCRQCVDINLCNSCLSKKRNGKQLVRNCLHSQFYDFGGTVLEALQSPESRNPSLMSTWLDELGRQYGAC